MPRSGRVMTPLIVGRALALVRCPDGIGGQTFFQKHAWKGLNRNICLRQRSDGAGTAHQHSRLRRADGARAVRGARDSSLGIDRQRLGAAGHDRDGSRSRRRRGLDEVIAAAERSTIGSRALGLASFVKTSGGKGLHVVSPIKPEAQWPAVKAFTKAIAESMAADSPDRFVSTIPKARRHRQDPDRLSAQSAGHDRRLRLFHPRKAGRAGLDAARLGRARPRLGPLISPSRTCRARRLRPTRGRTSAPRRRPFRKASIDLAPGCRAKRARLQRFRSCFFPCPCRPRRCASAHP